MLCAEHGVRQVRLPWAEARARVATLFERLAIEWDTPNVLTFFTHRVTDAVSEGLNSNAG